MSQGHRGRWFVLVLLLGELSLLPGMTMADSELPQTNSPVIGRSLFDEVFSTSGDSPLGYALPFPFSALIARLEAHAGSDVSGISNVKIVLVPYGRSLQRHAGRNKQEIRPRIVVAVDGAATIQPGKRAVYLKDRLFIGYHPDTATLEVLSFNPAGGRFEFQVVSDYAQGKRPRIRYASRKLCTACHHDEGPIFPEDSWNETMANKKLRGAMQTLSPPYEPAWLTGGTAAVAAFDNATDRGALLPLYDRLWRSLCTSDELQATMRCRAGAFLAMLRQRMGPFVFFTPRSALYLDAFRATAKARWRQQYPDGLTTPSPDLTNRHPLRAPGPVQILAADDPLLPRGKPAKWQLPSGLDRLILGWAESLPDFELARLDRTLRQRISAVTQEFSGVCELARNALTICRLRAESESGSLIIRLRGNPGQDDALLVESVTGPEGTRFYAVNAHHGADRHHLFLRQRGRDLSLRFGDGRRLGPLQLVLDDTGAVQSAKVEVITDFPLVAAAMEELVRDALGSNTHPLRGGIGSFQTLLGEVNAKFNAPHAAWCCSLPRPRPKAPEETSATVNPSSSIWTRRCGGCHDQPGGHPPRFLVPSSTETGRRLRMCAPAILARLSLWGRPIGEWTTSPMPPWRTIEQEGFSHNSWATHPDLAALRAQAKQLAATPLTAGDMHECRFPAG